MAGLIDFNFDLRDKNGDLSFGNLVNLVRDVEDRTSRSLTQYIKRSMIASRVFIQREVADEEILPDLLLTLQQMYIGWILTAMQMNTYVDNARTVRTALDIVATEDMKHVATEDLLAGLASYTGAKLNVIKEDPVTGGQHETRLIDTTTKKDLNLPSGRIVEVRFNCGGDDTKALTVNLYVQLMPTFIPSNVASEFFQLNFKPSLKQRWFQVTAGEKRFIADFLMEMDLLKKRKDALKNDKSGLLMELLDRQKNSLLNFLLKLGGVTPERQNIANTVHVYEKSAFDRWCSDSSCDFRRFDHRTKFFNRTFSMVVAVVDSAYGRVDMYFHGINNRGEYNFNQLHQQAKNEKYDLQSIMKAYYSSSAPKF